MYSNHQLPMKYFLKANIVYMNIYAHFIFYDFFSFTFFFSLLLHFLDTALYTLKSKGFDFVCICTSTYV